MKLKAVVSSNFPASFISALNRIRGIVMERVIGPILNRPDFGSAEFYVQKCDEVDGETHSPMCEVRLTGVSITTDRCQDDFFKARAELEKIYAEIIETHFGSGMEIQLMVSIMLDQPLKNGSTLIEGTIPAIIIAGRK